MTYTKGIQTDTLEEEAPRKHEDAAAAPVTQQSEPEKEQQQHVEPPKPIGLPSVVPTPACSLGRLELNENQVQQIMSAPDFQSFFDRSSRIVERALNERYDVAVDYTLSEEDKDAFDFLCVHSVGLNHRAEVSLLHLQRRSAWSSLISSGRPTVLSRVWTGRPRSEFTRSTPYRTDRRSIPSCWWPRTTPIPMHPTTPMALRSSGIHTSLTGRSSSLSTRFVLGAASLRRSSPLQSAILSTCFARYHPNLVFGGSYSGQIVLWDNRAKRTPVQRSALSSLPLPFTDALPQLPCSKGPHPPGLLRRCHWYAKRTQHYHHLHRRKAVQLEPRHAERAH